eukprot:1157781-Pelagomonas_calceolata.AAC.5
MWKRQVRKSTDCSATRHLRMASLSPNFTVSASAVHTIPDTIGMSSFLGQEQGEGKLFGSRDSHYVAKSVSNISDSERRLQPRGSGRSPGCAAEQKTRGEALSGSEAQGCWLSFMLQQLMGCWLSFMLQQLRAEFNANDWIPSYGAHTTLECVRKLLMNNDADTIL